MLDSRSLKPVLVYFTGCPNASEAQLRLRNAGLDFDEEDQNVLPRGHAHLKFTSPTLLLGEKIVFGSTSDSEEGGCSLDLPEASEIRERLDAINRAMR